MAKYRPPQPLNFLEPNWDRFMSQYEMFRLLTDLDKKPGPVQVASLKYCMGPEAEDVFKTFNLSDDDAKNYKTVVDTFKNYFSPRKNVLRLRRLFYRRTQQAHEDTEVYLRALFNASEYCDFGDRKESIRDQFVSGILNEDLAEKIELLYYSKDGQLSLDDVVEYSRTYNDVHDGRKLEKEQAKTVDEVKTYNSKNGSRPREDSNQSIKNCKFCGRSHMPRKCPAYGKSCNKCKKQNHFASVCRQDIKNKVDAVSDSIANIHCNVDSDGECQGAQAYLGEVATKGCSKASTNAMRVTMKIESCPVTFKVDTGADVLIMKYETFLAVQATDTRYQMEKADKKLLSPAGKVDVVGMVCVPLNHKGRTLYEKMYVVAQKCQTENLLSRGAAVDLQIISFLGAVSAKDSIFGFEKWKTEPVNLSLSEEAIPFCVQSARSVAIPLLSAVKENLAD